jgi:hypothetical protein
MSPASGSEKNDAPSKPVEDASAMPRTVDSGLLERVLRQTLAVCGPDEPIDATEMQALREVAARYRGRPLELEPVAVDLVAAAIDGLCPSRKNGEFWRNVTLQVARLLMDDPSSFARMNALWIRLGGVEP